MEGTKLSTRNRPFEGGESSQEVFPPQSRPDLPFSKPIHIQLHDQIDQLWRRDIEPVAVGGEVAAGAAGIARTRPVWLSSLLRLDPRVDVRYFLDESAMSFG